MHYREKSRSDEGIIWESILSYLWEVLQCSEMTFNAIIDHVKFLCFACLMYYVRSVYVDQIEGL